jgi:hypothetical protein
MSFSPQENVQYYRFSAYSGDARSQTVMGFLHLEGAYGVEQDYDEAREFFEQVRLADGNVWGGWGRPGRSLRAKYSRNMRREVREKGKKGRAKFD